MRLLLAAIRTAIHVGVFSFRTQCVMELDYRTDGDGDAVIKSWVIRKSDADPPGLDLMSNEWARRLS